MTATSLSAMSPEARLIMIAPTKPALDPELLRKMNAYWRAANYLSVGQIYLYANPLLRESLTLAHVKPLVVGHWGTTPGQSFIYVLGTQAFATFMAVYGFHVMTPIGWDWAGFVWSYAVICALLTDPMKLLAYRIFDRPAAAAAPATPKKPLNRPQKAASAAA